MNKKEIEELRKDMEDLKKTGGKNRFVKIGTFIKKAKKEEKSAKNKANIVMWIIILAPIIIWTVLTTILKLLTPIENLLLDFVVLAIIVLIFDILNNFCNKIYNKLYKYFLNKSKK
jgi:hypothetical protein